MHRHDHETYPSKNICNNRRLTALVDEILDLVGVIARDHSVCPECKCNARQGDVVPVSVRVCQSSIEHIECVAGAQLCRCSLRQEIRQMWMRNSNLSHAMCTACDNRLALVVAMAGAPYFEVRIPQVPMGTPACTAFALALI